MAENTKKITSAREVLEFAIQAEINANAFYMDAAQKISGNPELKIIFEDLAAEEAKHEMFLKNFLEGGTADFVMEEVEDYGVSETIERPELSTNMNFADAIALAVKNEEDAMAMYNRLAVSAPNAEDKKLFYELEKMEAQHKVRLEEIFTNASYGEVW